MKTTILGLALAATVACMVPAKDASAASDFKVYAGSGCKVFGSTAWTDLQFGAAGIINLTDVPKNIICPIIRDSEVFYDGATNYANVHLHVATGSVAARTVCNFYTINGDSGGGVVNTYTYDSGTMAANTDNGGGDAGPFVDNTSGNGPNHHSMMVLCTLGPRARLRFYSVNEIGATNTP